MAKTAAMDIPEPAIDQNALMARMVSVLEKLGDNQKPYEPGFGDPAYQARLRAEGYFDVFPFPVFQNGRECEPRGLSEETRERASTLQTGGPYIGGLVSVERLNRCVHIKYKSASVEDRMRYAGKWRDFSDLIDQLWAAQHPPAAA